jgi:TRAP-type mannitol/chloroaromatic compound transport system substrate-binding protein
VFESFDGVANGVVEAAMDYSSDWRGKDPLFTLTPQPGSPLGTFAEGAYLVEKLEPWFEKLYAKHRIKYLGHAMTSPINEQLMSVTPINSIEDVKGKKIRSSGFGALFYRALGATTVSLSAPEIYTAFQTKNIDAAEWTFWDENMRMGFHEVPPTPWTPPSETGPASTSPWWSIPTGGMTFPRSTRIL